MKHSQFSLLVCSNATKTQLYVEWFAMAFKVDQETKCFKQSQPAQISVGMSFCFVNELVECV